MQAEAVDLREAVARLTKEGERHSQRIDELSREVEQLRSVTRTPPLPPTSTEALRLEELHEMSASPVSNSQLVPWLKC